MPMSSALSSPGPDQRGLCGHHHPNEIRECDKGKQLVEIDAITPRAHTNRKESNRTGELSTCPQALYANHTTVHARETAAMGVKSQQRTRT